MHSSLWTTCFRISSFYYLHAQGGQLHALHQVELMLEYNSVWISCISAYLACRGTVLFNIFHRGLYNEELWKRKVVSPSTAWSRCALQLIWVPIAQDFSPVTSPLSISTSAGSHAITQCELGHGEQAQIPILWLLQVLWVINHPCLWSTISETGPVLEPNHIMHSALKEVGWEHSNLGAAGRGGHRWLVSTMPSVLIKGYSG